MSFYTLGLKYPNNSHTYSKILKILLKLEMGVYFKFQLELLNLEVCGINYEFLSKTGENRETEGQIEHENV